MGHDKLKRAMAALLFTALAPIAGPTMAVDSDLYLAGLGLHQETGRNIYLGGIYLERETPRPADLTEAAGSRIMEYRVVARRTSIRSLLGGMLLQSEVATGHPPDKATADFVDMILSAVSTSLYAGDSLEIRLSEEDETIALLNGNELARIREKAVADYLLMGWVGDSGPSTSFRNNITAGEVDPALLSELEANTYSAQRQAEIAGWLQPAKPEAEAIAAASAQEVATSDSEAATGPANAAGAESTVVADSAPRVADSTAAIDTVASAPDTSATAGAASAAEDRTQSVVTIQTKDSVTAQNETATVSDGGPKTATTAVAANGAVADSDTAADGAANAAHSTAGSAPGKPAEPIQVASLLPTREMLPVNPLQNEVDALGIQEYSQRLAKFHSRLVRMVYGEIHYPKRAVRRSIEGRLELDVTLNAAGDLLDIAVATGSGHDMLDEAAVDAARDAFGGGLTIAVDPVAIAEFGDFKTEQMTIPVPVSFHLQ